MHVELYADVIFLINFIMDFLILLLVSKLHQKPARILRILLGSLAAAFLHILFLLIPALASLYNFFGSLAIICITVYVTFNPKRIKEFLKLTLLTHVVAFSIGGACLGLFYYTSFGAVLGNMLSFTVRNFSFAVLLCVSGTTYILIQMITRQLKAAALKKQVFYPVVIQLGCQNVSMTALVDTGNTLVDPVSRAPVMIAEFAMVKEFLPEAFQTAYANKQEMDLQTIFNCVIDTSLTERIRLLPFKSLGNENGMIIGFKPDGLEITEAAGKISIQNVIVGISNSRLSMDGSYQALLNPQLLQNEL